MTTEDYLKDHAGRMGEKTAIVCGDTRYTYRQLWEKVQVKASRIREENRRAVVFRSTQSADFIVTYLAVHTAGCVAVPLEKDIPEQRMRQIKKLVLSSPVPEEAYDILFTTGTTGVSKGVVVSRRANMANAENLIAAQGFRENTYFIICGPLNHIGNLSKLHPTLIKGGTLCILESLKDLSLFYRAVKASQGYAATFLVPTQIRMLTKFSGPQLRQSAPLIDFMETGAAPISQSDMETLCAMLPQSRLFNTYASTETGIVATHDFNGGPCVAGCLGKPMKHSEILISDEGLIVCRGDTLMSGYVGDSDATSTVLHDNALYTRDRGYFDKEGRLHLQGREGDIINVGGFKVNPTEVEDIVMAVKGVKDCICIAVPHPLLGHALKLLVVPETEESRPSFRSIATILHQQLEGYKVPQLYEYVGHVERTYNGKLNRKAYESH